jgi:hypothetical protein
MGGIPEGVIRGGQGRSPSDCLWYTGVIVWVALNLAALVIASFPSKGEPPCSDAGGSLFRPHTAPAPILSTFTGRARHLQE